MERRVWVTARDGERIPVSLVWRRDVPTCDSAMFITGYGAYEISSDPGFAVSRISMLDRGVLYAVPHIRGGGEMGRAWYEQGTCSTRSIRLRETSAEVISGIIADEAAIGMVNSKTTAVRVIPAIGKKAGDVLEFGGLLGSGPIMNINQTDNSILIHRKGRIPAPLQSLKKLIITGIVYICKTMLF